MAHRAGVVSVWVEPLTHEFGHWCRTCRLSTGLRMWIVVHSSFGMILQSRLVCHECGGHDVIVDPDAAAA